MENKKKIYVGNLPYSMTANELRETFSEFGEIVDAVIITDKYNNRSKGFGFVEFSSDDAAAKAIESMHEKEVGGRNLVVNVARPPRDDSRPSGDDAPSQSGEVVVEQAETPAE